MIALFTIALAISIIASVAVVVMAQTGGQQ